MRKSDKQRQKRLQKKREKRHTSRKNKRYNPPHAKEQHYEERDTIKL